MRASWRGRIVMTLAEKSNSGRASLSMAITRRTKRLRRLRMMTATAVEMRELRKWAGSAVREWDFWKEREAAKMMPART